MKLGVLDLRGAIEDTIVLAPLVEQLGYARYWIAEHQPQPSPILLASLVAGQTETIRVGTAGVLLHYYPPLRTAHDFSLLERVFPGRIDAGFCGGVTLDPALLADDLDGRDLPAVMAAYPERVARFVHHVRNTGANPAFTPRTTWAGAADEPPELWSLGGGARSAELAARHGLGFGYALMFVNSRDEPAAAQHYRERFVPHPDRQQSRLIVAIAGVVADSDAAATELARSIPHKHFSPRIVGGAQTCVTKLADVARRYGSDEIVFADLCPDLDARTRCYELLADAAGLAR